MKSSNEILDELREMSPFLAGIEKTNVFLVPEGYFNLLETSVLNRINSPVLGGLKRKTTFELPDGYFESLGDNILLKINQSKPQDAVIIRINRRRTIWQYARAAVMTGVIFISALMVYKNQYPYLNDDTSFSGLYRDEQQINEGISKLSNEEIIKYLEASGNATDNETLTNSIDEKQIPDKQEFLNSNAAPENEGNVPAKPENQK